MESKEKNNSRRGFFKTLAVGAGAATLGISQARSAPESVLSDDRMGVLVDTTICVGCRNCEWACKTAHNMPTPGIDSYADRSVFHKQRRPSDKALTVVNEYHNIKNPLLPINVKVQCMHCDRPACVSACIVGAIKKYPDGSVVWDTDKCIGCRYCMVACPFQVPTFEYDKAIQPEIRKCDFCINRTKQDKLPACVDICPVEAMSYGPRPDIIKLARDKIKRYPDRYINHVYGEHEVNGTSWVYLAGKSFYELGFPKLSNKAAPGVSEAIQHGIFAYFVPPVMFYSMLGAIMWINKRRKEIGIEEEEEV
jgi:formate dehydrogenase iron-sulfur subunit